MLFGFFNPFYYSLISTTMRKVKILMAICFFTVQAVAQKVNLHQVDIDEASQIAAEFFGNNNHLNSPKHKAKSSNRAPVLAYKAEAKGKVSFYVFNNPAEGFALVGGEIGMPSVLGYSAKGSFDINRAPNSLLWLMERYKANGAIKPIAKNTTRRSVAPLLTTTWGQNYPYNDAIPSYDDEYPFITGCTATAIAQIMKYHKHPQRGVGSKSYSVNYGSKTVNFSANFGNTTYDWDNMLDEYNWWEEYPQKQVDAVATLMYHVGVSENMIFGDSYSGGDPHDGAKALMNNFKYDKNIRQAERRFFTDEEWENTIYNEIANGRPVLYGGEQITDEGIVGHEFVLHGYDADLGLYAVNWGWDGYCDGHFAMTGRSALDPFDGDFYFSRRNRVMKSSDGMTQTLKRAAPSDSEKPDCDKRPNLVYKLATLEGTPNPKEVVGVVADGCSQVKIRLAKESDQLPKASCGYSYKWTLSENIGKLENTESAENVIYTAPEDFPENKPGSELTIQANLTASRGNVHHTYKVNIKIVRVPVLFVHGLNDKAAMWNGMKSYLKKAGYPDWLLFAVDYSSTHNDSFEQNKTIVGIGAQYQIKVLLDYKQIVCSKVDVVGHSMGGLLTRKYVQNNGPELFHKIITLNTPHGGSQLGNFATDPIVKAIIDYTKTHVTVNDERYPLLAKPIDKEWYRVERDILSSGLDLFLPSGSNKTINDGAVYDLSVDGEAINKINQYLGGIKCHAIATVNEGRFSFNEIMGKISMKFLGYNDLKDFLDDIYNGDMSDIVVPLTSQLGGLESTRAAWSCINPGPWHSVSSRFESVQNEIYKLLIAKTNSEVFSNGFSKTPALEYKMEKLENNVKNIYPHIFRTTSSRTLRQNRKASSSSADRISFKLDCKEGSKNLGYRIANAENYDNIAFACMLGNNLLAYTQEPEGTVDLTQHVQGDLIVMCEGENKATGEWEFASDTIQVRTFADSDLERIEFVQDTICVREENSESVYVMCYWNDGTTTNLEEPSLSIANQKIASVEGKYVKGYEVGETTIKASYLGKECTAQVVVFDTAPDFVPIELEDYGFTSNQIIFYNIKPDEGGSYFIHPALYDEFVVSEQKNGRAIESVSIDRASGNNKTLYMRYTPYNSELSDAKFQYGVICRNIRNGHCYAKYGGSTNNLYGQALPPGAFYSQSVSMSFSTSIIPYNGKYEVLPAYSLDNGGTWEVMYYNVSQKRTIAVR